MGDARHQANDVSSGAGAGTTCLIRLNKSALSSGSFETNWERQPGAVLNPCEPSSWCYREASTIAEHSSRLSTLSTVKHGRAPSSKGTP